MQTPLLAEGPEYYHSFVRQLNELKEQEQLLKIEIDNSGLSSASIDKLIKLYRARLNLLEQLGSTIKKMNEKAGKKPLVHSSKDNLYLNLNTL